MLEHQEDFEGELDREMPVKRKRMKDPASIVRQHIYRTKQYFTFDLPREVEWRYSWVAGWLGIIPGLGQLYNHQARKAFWFFLGWVILLGINVYTLTRSWNVILNILLVLYMLWSFNDCVITATRINGQKWTPRQTLALLSYLVFTLGVILILSQYFFTPVFKLVYVSQDVFSPTIKKGDRLFVDCVTYWFRTPRHGEIVFYDPPRYTIEKPGALTSEVYVINERRGFGRVVALPGDRYERRDGEYYINSAPAPPELQPLSSSALWEDIEFKEIPEGHMLVLIGHTTEDSGILGTGLLGGKSPGFEGLIVKGWEEACLLTKDEIFGRCVAIYHPPSRRRWLLPSNEKIRSIVQAP